MFKLNFQVKNRNYTKQINNIEKQQEFIKQEGWKQSQIFNFQPRKTLNVVQNTIGIEKPKTINIDVRPVVKIPLLCKNQDRLVVSESIQTRQISRRTCIDLHSNLNVTNSVKTIVHVLGKENGFGDYLRGSILLATYAKHFNINFRMDVSRHVLSECLQNKTQVLPDEIGVDLICFNSTDEADLKLYSKADDFVNKSKKNEWYVCTNLYYNKDLVSEDIKQYINTFLTFSPNYYETASNLFEFTTYTVLHIRCLDSTFYTDFCDDNFLFTEILKLQLPKNTIIMSNNYTIKLKLHNLFGFYFVDMGSHHSGQIDSVNQMNSFVLEYILLSKATETFSFSYYHHGSGFSEQCSVLNDIFYRVTYLPSVNLQIDNINLLLNHYNEKIENKYVKNVLCTSEYNVNNYDSIAFVTLTNNGYVDYTLNCIESLKKSKSEKNLQVYCIGKKGHDILTNNNVSCEWIDDETACDFQEFRKKKWSNVTYHKFEIIHANLLTHKFVCITDGDIVYEKNGMFDFLLSNISDNDLLIQSEGLPCKDVCSGFMFIQSNETTLDVFNPQHIQKYQNVEGWDDQIYLNTIKYSIKYKLLPLDLFPTGRYFYDYSLRIKAPFLIHFNWIIGHKKKQKMLDYGKWYMSPKVKIFQHGTDGFGHQLEGMLRLMSLAINNKALYYYDPGRSYSFEHANFDLSSLTQYLKEATDQIFHEQETLETCGIVLREQRTFEEIIQSGLNIKNTVFGYDGVSSSIANQLPPNFEKSEDVEKALPLLRNAFVRNNTFLPTKSYDDEFVNVCCHFRLGDAVGQRILDTDSLMAVVREFQKYPTKYRIVIHTDGDLSTLNGSNTVIHDAKTDVLQVLSDFVHADIFIMNYSSLSIAAHLLADEKQNVICPTYAGPTFKHRILMKCLTAAEVFQRYKT
jgi:hypothetical protein